MELIKLSASNLSLAALGKPQYRKIKDPLGLGVKRAPPPPDPDVFDPNDEAREYVRSTLSKEELDSLEIMDIKQVRELIQTNSSKEDGACPIDPEMIAIIDPRIDYKIFVTSENIFTREELYEHYAFQEFGTQPEMVFSQQELGIFNTVRGNEYAARDIGDDSIEFTTASDLIRECTPSRMPHKIVKTKVFLGKERWDDFLLLQKVARGTNSLMRMISGPADESSAPADESPAPANSEDIPTDAEPPAASIESRLAKLEETVAMLLSSRR